VHTRTSGKALFFGKSLLVSNEASGTFFDPATWPDAYSALSLTSISTAFSRLMSCTASFGDTLFEPPAFLLSIGHRSMAPDENAARNKTQLSIKN